MIKVFYGTDRIKTEQAIERYFSGSDYESVDGSQLLFNDLPNLFFGVTLFSGQRQILIKNLTENKELIDQLKKQTDLSQQVAKFLETTHQIAVWEPKIDKRSSLYKTLAKHPNFSLQEINLPVVDRGQAFAVFDLALRDGPRAAKLLSELETEGDPQMVLGAWSWKAIDNFKRHQGAKEKRVLHALSDLDLKLKTCSISPWLLLRSFLLELSQL